MEILQVHARDKKLAPRIDFRRVARATAGSTGADLMNVMNTAGMVAVRRGSKVISEDDVFQARAPGPRRAEARPPAGRERARARPRGRPVQAHLHARRHVARVCAQTPLARAAAASALAAGSSAPSFAGVPDPRAGAGALGRVERMVTLARVRRAAARAQAMENIQQEKLGAAGTRQRQYDDDIVPPALRKGIVVYEAARVILALMTPLYDEISKVLRPPARRMRPLR